MPAVEHGAPPAGPHGPAGQHGPAAHGPEGGPAYQPVLPVVADTPALKGYPGGPGLDEAAEDEASQGGREARVLASPSVWQNAQKAWRDSGVEWQRSVGDYEPAEAEFERIKSAPHSKRRTATRAASSGQLSARSAGALSATLARQSASGSGQPRRPSGGGGGLQVRRGVWLTAVVIIVVAALVVGGLVLFGSNNGTPKPAAIPQYPAATPAAADFGTGPGQVGRGIFQGVTGVAAAGGTVVAVGAQTGQWLSRAQFLVSTDGGQSWRLAAQRSATGAQPAPGYQPQLVTHGAHGWLAVGRGAAWTSPDGQTWTLANGSGIGPLDHGDAVAAVAGTSGGFIAVGDNVPKGNPGQRNPVVWTSQNGQTWQRLAGPKLKLNASGGRVLRINYIAASGNKVVIAGTAYAPTGKGKGKHRKFSVINSVWRSHNGGASWNLAHLPAGKGVSGVVTGVATAGTGFVAIRPGSSKATGDDVTSYTSATGASWAKSGTITAAKSAHLRITRLAGSDQGAVATGQVSGGRVTYVSTNGHGWKSLHGVSSAAQILTGITVTSGGAVVAGGATNPTSVTQAPYLVLAASGKPAHTVSFGQIAGATGPSLRLDGIAAAAGKQVAVGALHGLPAIWSAPAGTGGHWTPAQSAALSRPGLSVLTGVTHGRDGWVAVGGTVAGAAVQPIVVGSASGTAWQAADSESAFSGPGITVHAVAAGPSGYVAAGQQAIPAKTTTSTTGHGKHKKTVKHVTPGRTVAAAWWSSGLTGWHRASVVKDSGKGAWQIAEVSAYKSGFVAVGSVGKSPAAWTSSNGQTWKLVQLGPPTGASTATLSDVAVRGSVIVATGMAATSAGNTPFADYSTDGGTIWQQEQLTAPGGAAGVTALTAASKGFVATGTAGQPGNQRVVVWWSTGGFSWKPIEPTGAGINGPGEQAITALTASGSALTGLGYQASTAGQQPTLWHATAGP
ncbi:MAG TPA: sialidase family protein [Streptosporangiaceae bacterium]